MRGSLNKKRLGRTGYYSLVTFSLLFILLLFAELIASDKPLIVKYKESFYFPILSNFSEKTFGGDFETISDYKDPYLQNLIKKSGGWVVFSLISYGPQTINYDIKSPAPSKPSKDNWLGTDDNGRDVLSRIIYGLRTSLIFGLILTTLSSFVGILVGAIQGYFGGMIDLLSQRLIEIWSSMPVLFLLVILSSVIEPGFWILLTIIFLFSWVSLVGMVRAEFLKIRNYDFVMAAKAIGSSNSRIIFKHILPNALSSSLASIPFLLSSSIITLTSLDFLGLGMPIGSPSLGEILAQGKDNINAYWIGISGFVVITFTSSLLVFIGESIRNSINTRSC